MLQLQCFGQGIMIVNNKGRIEYLGETFRPGLAAKQLCDGCDQADYHFRKAKTIKTWNIVLSNLSVAEFLLAVSSIQNETAIGVVHASLGGSISYYLSRRAKKYQNEIQKGVSAFNMCQLVRHR